MLGRPGDAENEHEYCGNRENSRVESSALGGHVRRLVLDVQVDAALRIVLTAHELVTDAAGNETRVDFDLGGRRTEIESPDSGHTTYEYDVAGNLAGRITPNLRGRGKIVYGYDVGRLVSVTYPQNADSNVAIVYGTAADGPNALGRIRSTTDRSGTTTFEYDALGRAVREERTVGGWRGSNHQESYVTRSSFDTWGRVQQMVYPDGEVLTYRYDSGGQVRSAEGSRFGTSYPYIQALEYDRFGAIVYEVAGNGTVSHRSYEAETRRVDILEAGDFQNVDHQYDAVGQLTDLVNDVAARRSDRYGGSVSQHFEYDSLERLTHATGTWNRPQGGRDTYQLDLDYDDLHNLRHKTQVHEVTTRGNSHPIPQHDTTYDLSYVYGGRRPHAATSIGTATYEYDANGNQTRRSDSPATRNRRTEWDEESLPRAITVAGHRTEFVYDASGTRVAKIGAQGETVYVNPAWTIRNGTIATKHIYVGGRRVASKILPGAAPSPEDPDLVAGMLGRWYEHRSDSGHEHANNTTMNPHYRVPSSMPTNGAPESNFVYFYHGDMIGSVSYVTDKDGELFEHNQFFASGEAWVRQNSNSERLPFLFTGAELDQETDLYAFGVRMYDPREQRWLSPDPALPMVLSGGPSACTPRALEHYSFGFNNPVMYSDPSGLFPVPEGYDEEHDIEFEAIDVHPRSENLFGESSSDDLGKDQDDETGWVRRDPQQICIGRCHGQEYSEFARDGTEGAAAINGFFASFIPPFGELGDGLDVADSSLSTRTRALAAVSLFVGVVGPNAGAFRRLGDAIDHAADAASGGARVMYHGTDADSALRLANGEALDAARAAAGKVDGPPGFFLATHVADAEYFAIRRGGGAILQYRFSSHAVNELGGLATSPLGRLGNFGRFEGAESRIPVEWFDRFNDLRVSGHITVAPLSP